MRYRIVFLSLMFLVFPAGRPVQAGAVSITLESGGYNYVPEPRLRYPISDTVFLDADDPLEFRWWNDSIQTRIFTIKVYKGYNMYAGNLIYKNDIPSGDSSVKVDSAVFEDGQVYTWSLIRVSLAGYKSDRSFNSFKVTRGKKA